MQRWAYTLVSPSTSQLADGQASSYSAYFLVSLHQQQVRPVWRLKGKRVKNPYSPAAVSCPWRRKQRSLNTVFGKTFTAWQQVRIPAVARVYVASWVRFGAFGTLSLACFVAFHFVKSCLFTSFQVKTPLCFRCLCSAKNM